jgi:DNA-binding response OmpR family regulator
MRIAVHSASASITRTLESIIAASGHHLAKGDELPDLVIKDTHHPAKPNVSSTAATLTLGAAASESAIVCPVRPERIIQRLMMLGNTQTIPLAQGWSLDMLARMLQHEHGAHTSLTEKECSLLKYLAQAHPEPLGRDDLLEHVWGMAGEVDTHTLETHIYRLRNKLGELSPAPCDILTHEGAYMLALDEKSR